MQEISKDPHTFITTAETVPVFTYEKDDEVLIRVDEAYDDTTGTIKTNV